MQYSVNIGDLTKDTILGSFLVSPVCPNKTIVKAEPKYLDGGAILLETDEVRAKAIVDVIRLKYPRNLLRCYESKTGKSWERV